MIILIAFLAALCSCKDNPVQQYGNDLVDSYEYSSEVADQSTIEAAKRTITAIRATEGRYPKGLDEISASMGVPLDPNLYDYDPATGRIGPR